MQDLEKRNVHQEDVATSDAVSEKTNVTSEAGINFSEERKASERKLVRKLDLVILPLTALLYLSYVTYSSRSTEADWCFS